MRDADDDDARREASIASRFDRDCVRRACGVRALERAEDGDGSARGHDDAEGARASADDASERLTRICPVLRAKGSVGTPRVDAVWWINTGWTRIVDRRCTRRWRRRRTIEICVR